MSTRSTASSSRRYTTRAALLLAASVWLLATTSLAHPVPFSYFDLRLGNGRLEGTLTAHLNDLAHDLAVSPPESLLSQEILDSKRDVILDLLRSGLKLTADGTRLEIELVRIEPLPDRTAVAFHLRFVPQSYPGTVGLQCTLFSYEPEHQTFLNVYESDTLVDQEIFSKDRTTLDYYSGGRLLAIGIVKKFVPAGVYHIFAGPDHILFIIGLLLLGGSLKRLLTIVTAFTLAHSITLSLAALDIVNPPGRLIEASIALSIVFVGIDNLMVGEKGRDVRVWVAFFFGLVHGFGFASVLREFGLPAKALGWSLFSFNVGVEIGQIVIVVIVAALLTMIRNRNPLLARRIVVVGSSIVVAAGSYWFIQRLFL